ncbi:hypothetical protein LCGC14_1046860 [marine sediment metagenome]|uniref:Uncharacterized protein n=1 Tax=marine sediment metagenome TaxID=412755 RepID=A0A0F9QW71_9ZZZZ
MSTQITIEAFLDDSEARAQQRELEVKNEKISDAINENEKKTKAAFTKAMTAMRSGYMIISGFTQAMGGSMSQAFTAMYGIAMSSVQLYSALTPAVGAINPVAAMMMSVSLISAVVSLIAMAAQQEEFARAVSGVTMMVQGIGGFLDSMSFE